MDEEAQWREREREAASERRNKRNSSSLWDVKRWLPDSRTQTPRGSPTEEKKEFNFSDSPRVKQGPSAAAGKEKPVEEENDDEIEEISTDGVRAGAKRLVRSLGPFCIALTVGPGSERSFETARRARPPDRRHLLARQV